MQAQSMRKPDFISVNGLPIYIETQTDNYQSLNIYHTIKVGNEQKKPIKWQDIYQTLREVYGVKENAIPEFYKPVPLLEVDQEQTCCFFDYLKKIF